MPIPHRHHDRSAGIIYSIFLNDIYSIGIQGHVRVHPLHQK
jgi:hypothetical protein